MRKAIAVLFLAALLTALFVPALAAEEKKLGNVVTGYEAVVSDDAGLLSDSADPLSFPVIYDYRGFCQHHAPG